jgi:lactoylglutathione lyase
MTAASTRFGFTKLVVVDLDASASFYTAVFGVKEQTRVQAEIAGRPIEEIIFTAAGPEAPTLVLLRFVDQATPSHSELILGFITDDIDALFARVLTGGGAVAQAVETQPQHGVKVGFVTDPEGHLIDVVEMLAAH